MSSGKSGRNRAGKACEVCTPMYADLTGVQPGAIRSYLWHFLCSGTGAVSRNNPNIRIRSCSTAANGLYKTKLR